MPKVEQAGKIDIGEYARQYPNSRALGKLAIAVESGDKTRANGWWDEMLVEHQNGAIPADVAVAAYFATIHPLHHETDEHLGPEQARQLKKGEKVVLVSGFSGEQYGSAGILASDVEAILGHPQSGSQSYISVQLGLRFTNRKDRISIFPTQEMLIGNQAIIANYDHTTDYAKQLIDGKTYDYLPQQALIATATIRQLELHESSANYTENAKQLIALGVELFDPANIRTGYPGEASHPEITINDIAMLKYLYVIAPQETEILITKFATGRSFNKYQEILTETYAQIICPSELDSLHEDEQKMWYHKAAAKIYEIRTKN